MSVSVCIALLAASAAVSSAYAANDKSSAISSADLGYAALVSGRTDAAITNYSLAIESRKLPVEKLARALLNRALAFQKKGDHRRAIDDYTTAMRLDALSPKMRAVALYNRGLAQEKSGSAAMAIEDFTGALLLDPGFSQSYYSRANVLRKHGQYLLAIADYKNARRHKHQKPHLTLFGEALTYEALNQKTRARTLLLKAVSIKPEFNAARKKLVDLGSLASDPITTAGIQSNTKRISVASTNTTVNTLITGSITPSQSDLTIRKTPLPKPIGVPKTIAAQPTAVKMPPLPNIVIQVPEVTPVKTVSVSKPVKKQIAPSKTETAVATGWTVQLSSQRNSDAAWDVWKNLSTRYSSLLGRQKATVIKADLGTRGIFYRLRVHQLDSKKQASSLCKKLKRKGTGCFVSKA